MRGAPTAAEDLLPEHVASLVVGVTKPMGSHHVLADGT